MQELNKLTKKEYWSNNWKKIKLPARYLNDYSHEIISKLIQNYVSGDCKNFLEIGGCPGRWADYFFTKFGLECDSMDYVQENIKIIQENYRLIGIKGKAFLGDIMDSKFIPDKKYDIVLSDGLLEHFTDSSEVFGNHLKYLNDNGLLIVGVPNIKKSWFYDYFAKKDKIGYAGYRHIDKEELIKHAENNNLRILFCDYIGVFNIGLVYSSAIGSIAAKLFVAIDLASKILLKFLGIKKESKIFSPYIYLIAKK